MRNSGNVDGALSAVMGSSKDKYRDVFTALISSTPTNVDLLGTVVGGEVNEHFSEFVVTPSQGSGEPAHLIYFARNRDGVWRIDAM